MAEPVLRLSRVSHSYWQGRTEVPVLTDVDLLLKAGETVALVGPSGAGKSTLLHIAGLLETPSTGEVALAGQVVRAGRDGTRTRLRRAHLGFVYQNHHLMPEFSALENIMVPLRLAGQAPRAARARATELLDRVGLGARGSHRPAELSGGEQQRVAIARAVANAPKLLLADEPTGNLDTGTAADVTDMLVELVRATGLAALLATHNPEVARRMQRGVRLEAGHLHPWAPAPPPVLPATGASDPVAGRP